MGHSQLDSGYQREEGNFSENGDWMKSDAPIFWIPK